MSRLGMLLYGYNEIDATKIGTFFENHFNETLTLISASGKEKEVLEQILSADSKNFEEKETNILMFLGFTKSEIDEVMQSFKNLEGINRPIFCILTEKNLKWSFEYLISHLLEERKYFEERKKGNVKE